MTPQGRHQRGFEEHELRYVFLPIPRGLSLAVSIQREQNREHFIVRGQGMFGTPFCAEYLVNLSGEAVTGGRDIRRDTISYNEHLLRFREDRKDRVVVGFAGAGNVTMNPFYFAYAAGELFYADIPNLQITAGAKGTCSATALCSTGTGATLLADLTVDFRQNPPTTQFTDWRAGTEISDVDYAISGPQLVADGKAISPQELCAKARQGWFYDLRHLFLFPTLRARRNGTAGEIRIDVGLETFWPGGSLDGKLVEAALSGKPVSVDLSPYHHPPGEAVERIDDAALDEALTRQSYRKTPSAPTKPGEYRIRNDGLEIAYLPGIFNHSFLGFAKETRELAWLGVAGSGGQIGHTMIDAAALAAEHMEHALLIDNGGDVMCRFRGDWLLASQYRRTRIRGLILFVADSGRNTLEEKGTAAWIEGRVKTRPVGS